MLNTVLNLVLYLRLKNILNIMSLQYSKQYKQYKLE